MEMELDKSEIQQINSDLTGNQNQSEESKEDPKQHAQAQQNSAATFCSECKTHHQQPLDSLSGNCQYDGSEDGDFQEEDDEVGIEEDDDNDTLTGDQEGGESAEDEDEYFSENQDEMMEEEQDEEYGD